MKRTSTPGCNCAGCRTLRLHAAARQAGVKLELHVAPKENSIVRLFLDDAGQGEFISLPPAAGCEGEDSITALAIHPDPRTPRYPIPPDALAHVRAQRASAMGGR